MARRRRRRTARRRTTRRRRSRRRNPAKLDAKALAIGALAGAAYAGADFAMAGQDTLEPKYVGPIELGAGLLLGGIASMYHKELGVGLAAAGVAVGGASMLKTHVKSSPAKTTTTGALPGRPRAVAQLRAVQAPLGAVSAPIGHNVEAELSAVQALIEDPPSYSW